MLPRGIGTLVRTGLGLGLVLLTGLAGAAPHPYQVYNDTSGLPSSSVQGITQDPTGYIWFATRNGLTRYDGLDWHEAVQENDAFGRGCRDVAASASAEVAGAAALVPAPGGRILVLDDEEDLRGLVADMLGTFGIGCVGCGEGELAAERFAAARTAGDPFRAVILDLTVPGGPGGRDLLPRLRALDPKVPAIVISGYSSDEVLADCTRFGFDAALVKPFDRKALGAVLAQVLGAWRSGFVGE